MSSENSDSQTREEIQYININIARFKQDIPSIIRYIVREELEKFIKEFRKPKPYVEPGYRGS